MIFRTSYLRDAQPGLGETGSRPAGLTTMVMAGRWPPGHSEQDGHDASQHKHAAPEHANDAPGVPLLPATEPCKRERPHDECRNCVTPSGSPAAAGTWLPTGSPPGSTPG